MVVRPIVSAEEMGGRELVEDLGGVNNISTQQSGAQRLRVKSKLLIDSVDACSWYSRR
jgi:hypothetical protein